MQNTHTYPFLPKTKSLKETTQHYTIQHTQTHTHTHPFSQEQNLWRNQDKLEEYLIDCDMGLGSVVGNCLSSYVTSTPNQARAYDLSLNRVNRQTILVPFPQLQHIQTPTTTITATYYWSWKLPKPLFLFLFRLFIHANGSRI